LQAGGDGAVALAAFQTQAERQWRNSVPVGRKVGQQVGVAARGSVSSSTRALNSMPQINSDARGRRSRDASKPASVSWSVMANVAAGSGGAAESCSGVFRTVRAVE